MNKSEIKKAHEKAVGRELPKAIRDEARYEAHRRVREAVEPAREESHSAGPVHEAEHGEKAGHKVIPSAQIEHHLGHGSGKA